MRQYMVIDPCYLPDTSAGILVDLHELPTVSGDGKITDGERGDRVVGRVPVDSGSIAVIPVGALALWVDGDYPGDNHYSAACELSLSEAGHGVMKIGNHEILCLSTAHGDGSYDLHYNGMVVYLNTAEEDCYQCDGNGEYEESCQDCDGDGYNDETCHVCDGDSEIEDPDTGKLVHCDECEGNGTVEEDCNECYSEGFNMDECDQCYGKGYTE